MYRVLGEVGRELNHACSWTTQDLVKPICKTAKTFAWMPLWAIVVREFRAEGPNAPF